MSEARNPRPVKATLSACTIALAGCLPEPPAYDSCVQDESVYFTESPKGCSGHALSTLYESETIELKQVSSTYDVWSRPMVDDEYVYWVDASGRVLRTALSGDHTDVLFQGISSDAGVRGFDRERKRLYVLYEGGFNLSRSVAWLYGIDVSTGESQLVGDWVDFQIGGIVTVGDRYFVVQYDGTDPSQGGDPSSAERAVFTHSMLTGTLDGSKPAQVTDLSVCSEGEVIALTSTEQYVHYLDYYRSALVTLDPVTCVRVADIPIVPPVTVVSRLVQSDGGPYLIECDYTKVAFPCVLSRIDPSGRLQPLAQDLVLRSRMPLYVFEEELIWIAATPARLYARDWATAKSVTLAAALNGATTLTVQPDAVYVQQRLYSSQDGIFDTGDATLIERIVRVER